MNLVHAVLTHLSDLIVSVIGPLPPGVVSACLCSLFPSCMSLTRSCLWATSMKASPGICFTAVLAQVVPED